MLKKIAILPLLSSIYHYAILLEKKEVGITLGSFRCEIFFRGW
jgi:hypothetical protein